MAGHTGYPSLALLGHWLADYAGYASGHQAALSYTDAASRSHSMSTFGALPNTTPGSLEIAVGANKRPRLCCNCTLSASFPVVAVQSENALSPTSWDHSFVFNTHRECGDCAVI